MVETPQSLAMRLSWLAGAVVDKSLPTDSKTGYICLGLLIARIALFMRHINFSLRISNPDLDIFLLSGSALGLNAIEGAAILCTKACNGDMHGVEIAASLSLSTFGTCDGSFVFATCSVRVYAAWSRKDSRRAEPRALATAVLDCKIRREVTSFIAVEL